LTRDSIHKRRHSGARLFGANPESITTHGALGAGVAGTVVMDSGPARKRAHPGMTREMDDSPRPAAAFWISFTFSAIMAR
jgi:hypothetical protein